MTDTIDPQASITPELPVKKEPTTSLTDNDNLVLISLADLKRFFGTWDGKIKTPEQQAVMLFLEAFISDIEADKQLQLEQAQAAMEKFGGG